MTYLAILVDCWAGVLEGIVSGINRGTFGAWMGLSSARLVEP
jgi:hypothetical protein